MKPCFFMKFKIKYFVFILKKNSLVRLDIAINIKSTLKLYLIIKYAKNRVPLLRRTPNKKKVIKNSIDKSR